VKVESAKAPEGVKCRDEVGTNDMRDDVEEPCHEAVGGGLGALSGGKARMVCQTSSSMKRIPKPAGFSLGRPNDVRLIRLSRGAVVPRTSLKKPKTFVTLCSSELTDWPCVRIDGPRGGMN
jgi:hypothetical protein